MGVRGSPCGFLVWAAKSPGGAVLSLGRTLESPQQLYTGMTVRLRPQGHRSHKDGSGPCAGHAFLDTPGDAHVQAVLRTRHERA